MTEPSEIAGADGAEAVDSRAALPATAVFAERRAELGLSLEDVANQLKFAPRQIEALESGEFGKLPGGTFARGMMRSYARLLKLDPAPILAQLVASGIGPQAGPEQAVSLRAPIPFSEGGKHVNLVYTVMSVVILVVVAFFAFEWYQEKGAAPRLAFVAAGRDPAAVPTPGQEASQPASEPVVAAARSAPTAPPTTFASAGPPPVPETTPRAEQKKAGPPEPGKRRIVMRFDKESWVEIKGPRGTLLSQLNPAGSEKVIDGEPPFHLTIGNASSVHVTYNDQPVDLRPHFKVDVARLTLN